jgi:hypothetical protein
VVTHVTHALYAGPALVRPTRTVAIPLFATEPRALAENPSVQVREAAGGSGLTSQARRSCSSRATSSPSAETRAVRRASVSSTLRPPPTRQVVIRKCLQKSRGASAQSWPGSRSAATRPGARRAASRQVTSAMPGPATSIANEPSAARAGPPRADGAATGSPRPSTTPPAATSAARIWPGS